MMYFAYGSNLSMTRMLDRCPNAKPVCTGTLRFWDLNYRRNYKGRAVATIEKNGVRRGAVYGALYQVSADDLAIMDKFEGAPYVYYRVMVTVETKFGRIKAITYRMNDWFVPGKPKPDYLNIILRGYHDWKMPVGKLNLGPKPTLVKPLIRELDFSEDDRGYTL